MAMVCLSKSWGASHRFYGEWERPVGMGMQGTQGPRCAKAGEGLGPLEN